VTAAMTTARVTENNPENGLTFPNSAAIYGKLMAKKKREGVNLRMSVELTDDMRLWLTSRASAEDRSASAVVRLLISAEMERDARLRCDRAVGIGPAGAAAGR